MTARTVVEMCSANELQSFLVPAYGFQNQESARRYWESPAFPKEISSFGSDLFGPIFCSNRAYVPRISANSEWLTTGFLGGDWQAKDGKSIWKTLRSRSTPKPNGAYNIALLVEGPRQFFRSHHQTAKRPKWWYRIAEGVKDCFAVWGQKDGSEIGKAVFENSSTQVFAKRSGRGVIYLREAEFDNNGQFTDSRYELVFVEFSINDQDPARDDVLRMQVSHRTWYDDPDLRITIDTDDVWVELIERAQAGFSRCCKIIQLAVEKWLQFFIEQHAKAQADHRDYSGASFADRIRKMDWQKALEAVEEPWQLAVVVNRFARLSKFSSAGGYTILRETVPEMIRRHECSEDRRAELRQMVVDYVEPATSNWECRGD